ncbi:hypothetical protein DW650_01335 [Roseburia sp. AM23-20]|jgi:hypothetical protein|nr:hypothetical protein DW650_01335 [Roseburia sp. AM23-20]HBD65873.1 hypothetical protein [Eubacterium sp.]
MKSTKENLMYRRIFGIQMKKICYTKEYLKYKRTFVFGQKIREAALKYKQLLLCNKMTEIICIWYRNGAQREKKKYT